MSNKVKSGFLFSEPSFLSGASRLLDLWGQYDQYNQSLTPAEADARAIAADWIIIGQDLQEAMDEFNSEEAA
jgi:hypothetical protein